VNTGDFLSILLIAIGLSADCFAVALSAGISIKEHTFARTFRLSFSFGFFQASMLVLGWLAGRTIIDFIADYDHWVAFALLAFISGRMFWEAFHPEHSQDREVDITRGLLLLTSSVATSIDALAVGLSFAFLEVNMAMASPTVGAVSFAVTALGFMLGKRVSKLMGKRAEVLGAIILLVIAFRILLSHLLSDG
jgi:putative Mn2+ efflux pump MntP